MPDLALAPLRAISEAGLVDLMTLESPVTAMMDNGEEEIVAWVEEMQVDCLLSPAGERVVEWAAARGVQAAWAIRCPLDLEEIPLGWRGVVRGGDVEDGSAWQTFVRIALDMGRWGRRLHRMLAAVDESLS